MAGPALITVWTQFKRECPNFEKTCGTTYTKFGPALQAFDECKGRARKGSDDLDVLLDVVKDSRSAQKMIEEGLGKFADCINKTKDVETKKAFDKMKKAIMVQFPQN